MYNSYKLLGTSSFITLLIHEAVTLQIISYLRELSSSKTCNFFNSIRLLQREPKKNYITFITHSVCYVGLILPLFDGGFLPNNLLPQDIYVKIKSFIRQHVPKSHQSSHIPYVPREQLSTL